MTCNKNKNTINISLRITQAQDDFLSYITLGAGTTKSDYLRALIDREMNGDQQKELIVQMTDEQAMRMTRIASQYMAQGE